MEVKTAVLADAANVSTDGKLNITGIFDRINAKEFPASWPSMSFVVRIQGHWSETGEHEMKVVVADQDGRKIAEMGAEFTIPKQQDKDSDGMPWKGQLIFPVMGARFPEPGIYSFDILIDGRYEDSMELLLVKRET